VLISCIIWTETIISGLAILHELKGRKINMGTKAYCSLVRCRVERASSWDSFRFPVFPSKHAINLALQRHPNHRSMFTIQVENSRKHTHLTTA
jgi:hypothetical protein